MKKIWKQIYASPKKKREPIWPPIVFVWIWSILTIFSLGMVLAQGRLIKDQDKTIFDMDVRIRATENKVPWMARYLQVVEQLAEASRGKMDARQVVDVAQVICEECLSNKEIGLTEDKIFAMIEMESGFDPKALSFANAYGLTQCMQTTFELHLPDFGYPVFTKQLAYNPVVNIKVGIAELKRLRKAFLAEGIDSWAIVFTGYYWGERATWEFISKRGMSIEAGMKYGNRVVKISDKWREKGL